MLKKKCTSLARCYMHILYMYEYNIGSCFKRKIESLAHYIGLHSTRLGTRKSGLRSQYFTDRSIVVILL